MIFLTGIVHLILDCFISKNLSLAVYVAFDSENSFDNFEETFGTNFNTTPSFSWYLTNGCIYYVCIAILMCIVNKCNGCPVYWSPASNHLDALISTFVYRQLRLDQFNFLIGDKWIAIILRKYILLMIIRRLSATAFNCVDDCITMLVK